MSENDITNQLATLKNNVKNTVRPQNRHLIPCKPGQRIPGGGRPKGKLDYKTIRDMAIVKLAKEEGKTPSEIEAELVKVALKEARDANYSFYKDDKDRIHGQAVSRSEIGGLEDANPIRIEVGVQRMIDKIYGDN